MNRANDFKLRQIRIDERQYLAIKLYCRQSRLRMSDFYQEAVQWFLTKSNEQQDLSNYFACCKNGYPMSLWINGNSIADIKSRAVKARVSEASIIFTAIINYLKHLNISA